MYQLVRTLPTGVEKTQGPVKRVRDAATFAAHVLHDNRLADKAEAQRFAAQLARYVDVGETLTHGASGYSFRIERV